MSRPMVILSSATQRHVIVRSTTTRILFATFQAVIVLEAKAKNTVAGTEAAHSLGKYARGMTIAYGVNDYGTK